MKKNLVLTAVVAMAMVSCNFLERYPEGGTLRQDQYEKLDDQLEGSVRGLYVKLYSSGSSSHDEFGERSFDLWGDILCSDMALTGKTYGWLYQDEQMLTVNRTGTIWGHYYGLIHNINATILGFKNSQSFIKDIDTQGWPSANPEFWTDSLVKANSSNAAYYAQCLGLRGYCYAQLAKWYTPVAGCEYMDGSSKGKTYKTYKCCPVYTEDNMTVAGKRQTSDTVYLQAFNDLERAIRLYDEFAPAYSRPNKLVVDYDVACAFLAQAYLNECVYNGKGEDLNDTGKEHAQKALDYAKKVIDRARYSIVKRDNLLDNGWNDVADPSWIWGQDVTVETCGGLKSWFGQVDIHSYSYAWAGDAKVLDAQLEKDIPDWDRREYWFNDGVSNSNYRRCPDGKFYSNRNRYSVDQDSIDKDWLSDNVFMRYESVVLTAAEAAYRLKDKDDEAKKYLFMITDERVKSAKDGDDEEYMNKEYEKWKGTLTTHSALRAALIYNWRMEMWGEGYGLETFRRWNDARRRGDNHDYAGSKDIKATETSYNMNIPSSESTYNNHLDD